MPRTRSHVGLYDAARAGLGRSVSDESVAGAGTPFAGDTPHAADTPCAAAGVPTSAAGGATSTPIMMTDQQLQLILQQVMRAQSVSVPPSPAPTSSLGNFTKCTARFDGTKQSDVLAFLDAVETYKDCVCVDETNAVRGLSMLLTGIAATWWKGVKQSVCSWNEAVELLKQTFGPRLPPHRVYRELFKQEQREESTDVFVCKARALLAQLPSDALSEVVQLDMVYGLLHRRIREKVARSSFTNFMDLLREARRIEDLYEEGRRIVPAVKESAQEGTSKGHSSSTTLSSPILPKRLREKCGYCKFYGHSKDACTRFKKKEETRTVEEAGSKTIKPTITCFGCGAPGVLRSNCVVCKEGRTTSLATSSNSAFQSVAVNNVCRLNPRVRPIFDVEVFGVFGTALLDTGAKQSVASVSLANHLRTNGQAFQSVETEFKFADGTRRVETVQTAMVNVRVQGVEIETLFMVLPGATESLLGMNFIQDAGLTLDFTKNRFTLRATGVKCEYDLRYQREDRFIVSSTIRLRECEGALLSHDDKEKLITLLKTNKDIFEPGGDPTPFAVHRIDTGDAAPISTPPYRVTPAKKEMIRVEIDKMLEEDIIEEAESEWTSPVVLVPKQNGKTRFCVDYRKLNAVTRTDKYPLPLIDEIIASTKPNCVMSTIDLKSGYWQVEVAPEDRHKTAFVTPFGTFQFRRMPFGLKNSPATFQRLMDRFRAGLSNLTVVAYLDDILVISDDLESHLNDLNRVFDRLRQFKLKENRNKCVFARESVVYLGHVITAQGIEPDPMKVQAVLEMAPPTKLKELRTFLQTCSWFRKFIPGFSEVARALTDLTKKDRPWKWGEKEAQSFEELKRRLATTPILRQPDFSQPFVLRTDASAYALGAVLLQGTEPKAEQPIEYASRLLTPTERNYSTTEREALALVWALDKFRGYLEGAQVRVATDHQPLKWLFSLKTPSGRLACWALKIQAFNLEVEYTPGKVNVIADTLSRPVCHLSAGEDLTCDLYAISVDLPHRTSEEIRLAQLEDTEIKKILCDFEDDNTTIRWTDGGYYLHQGVLFRFDPDGESEEPQLVVSESMREELMKEIHDAPTAGHLGLERTLKKAKERFYFPNLRQYVAKYLKSCELCQKFKPSNLKPAGLLQTLVQHQRSSNGEKWIFLVEDTASRWVELFPLSEANSENCAKILIEEIFMRYGFPRRVLSDNGVQFVSAVMQKAMHVLGVRQTLTPLYHPEANPAERKNREMKQMLAMLIDPDHRRWPEVLPAVQFALNTAPNQGTGRSAAFLTFARDFRSPVEIAHDLRTVVESQNYVPLITPYFRNFVETLQEVKWRIEHQQDIRNDAADKSRRSGRVYQEGDLVLVESNRPSQAAKGFTNKFAPRREGPYRINRNVSATTYEVADKNGKLKGKYHASLLTLYEGQGPVVERRRRGRPRKNPRVKPART